jgi:transposase
VDLTRGRLKASRETLVESLRGRVTKHHRFLLNLHLGQIKALDEAVDSVEKEAGLVLEPFRVKAELLTGITGVRDIVAKVIISEIGIDMSRFPTAGHLISGAGLCPRNDESAGKRRSTRLRKSGTWL